MLACGLRARIACRSSCISSSPAWYRTSTSSGFLNVRFNSSTDTAEIKRTRDQLIHTFTANLRVSVINNTHAARTAQKAHKLGPVEAQLLGKTMAGVLLLASFLEGEERIIAEMRGNGPINVISAEAIHVGEVRGYVHLNEHAKPPTSFVGALGEGIFKITKIIYRQTSPMVSVVSLQKGDIVSEFSHYMERSEQIPSALLFETSVDEHGAVEFSGGIIMQTLPHAPPDLIPQAQDLLTKNSILNSFLVKKQTLRELLQDFVPEKITEGIERTQVDFFCRCGIGNFKAKMSTLGHEELRAMQAEDAREVKCVNCSKVYTMSDHDFDDMHKILDASRKPEE